MAKEKDEKDFDEDNDGGGSDSVVERTQLVVRVRRDSGDSIGSEVSQSPPSSPPPRDQDCSGNLPQSNCTPSVSATRMASTPFPTSKRPLDCQEESPMDNKRQGGNSIDFKKSLKKAT